MNAPRLNLRTTAQVIKESSISFVSNFYTFLFLSLLLFSFRFIVESGTLFVTTFIDRDPSLKALLSRLDLAGKHVGGGGGGGSGSGSSSNGGGDDSFRSSGGGGGGGGNRRRRPFLHLSRVGTLDDDFFSSDDDDYDRSLFGLGKKTPVNGSSVNLSHFFGNLGFSDSEKNTHTHDDNNGIRVSEIVGSGGFLFKTEGFSFNDENDEDLNTPAEGEGGGDDVDVDVDDDRPPPPPDFQFFIKGLELGRRDAAALFFLVSFLSAAYGWVILGFLVTNSCILGIVFYVVVNSHLGKYNSFVGTIWTGCRLGIRRLSGFILMRWAARDAMTQLLGLWFFSEIEDQHSFFKLFVRLKLMPFSVTSPWIRGFEYEISGFLFTWFLLDTLVALVFAVDSWVAVMDVRMSGKEIVKEGCYLISTMLNQAIQIKAFEAILCGSIMRWGLGQIFGNLFAAFLQSVLEVFFMVVWLIYYFAARCKDTSSDGRMFGRRDLEDYIDGIR